MLYSVHFNVIRSLYSNSIMKQGIEISHAEWEIWLQKMYMKIPVYMYM